VRQPSPPHGHVSLCCPAHTARPAAAAHRLVYSTRLRAWNSHASAHCDCAPAPAPDGASGAAPACTPADACVLRAPIALRGDGLRLMRVSVVARALSVVASAAAGRRQLRIACAICCTAHSVSSCSPGVVLQYATSACVVCWSNRGRGEEGQVERGQVGKWAGWVAGWVLQPQGRLAVCDERLCVTRHGSVLIRGAGRRTRTHEHTHTVCARTHSPSSPPTPCAMPGAAAAPRP
jgi:hypothetical protein